MVFSEPAFLFAFLPLLLLFHFAAPHHLRNFVLLLFSLGFYAYGEKLFVGVMLLSIACNYVVGLGIDRSSRPRKRKLWLAGGLTGNLLLLAAFKYANFLVDNLNLILVTAGLAPLVLTPVHLPIGISFSLSRQSPMSSTSIAWRRKCRRIPFGWRSISPSFPSSLPARSCATTMSPANWPGD